MDDVELVGGRLGSEATLVLYDGAPFFPNSIAMMDMIDAEQISVFGTSAKYIDGLQKSGATPETVTSWIICALFCRQARRYPMKVFVMCTKILRKISVSRRFLGVLTYFLLCPRQPSHAGLGRSNSVPRSGHGG